MKATIFDDVPIMKILHKAGNCYIIGKRQYRLNAYARRAVVRGPHEHRGPC